MGTPMAVNYANLFLEKFETEMLDEYERKTNLRPYVWMRYIDDIFFIWQHDEKSLQEFIKFCDNYSTTRKMKSKIKFESNSSTDSVNFMDVNSRLGGAAYPHRFTRRKQTRIYTLTQNLAIPDMSSKICRRVNLSVFAGYAQKTRNLIAILNKQRNISPNEDLQKNICKKQQKRLGRFHVMNY